MITRHGNKKREVMWVNSKPTSTDIVPVLTERNAQQPMQEPLQQPPPAMTTCSDSHLCVQKEAGDACAPSIESVDIDQGGSGDFDLIKNRRRHNDIIEAFRKEHGKDYFPSNLIERNYEYDKVDLTTQLRAWASATSSYKFRLLL